MGRIVHIASALCLAVTFVSAQNVGERTAEQTVRPIIDRVIRETSFELRSVPLKPTLDIQVLDFGRQFGQASKSVACAFSIIRSRSDTTILFGMSRDLPLKVILNGRPVFTARGTTPFVFHEVGYEIFKFNDTLSFSLKKGMNSIVVKGRLNSDRNVVYLREMTTPGARPVASFDPTGVAPVLGEHGWGFLGPFSESSSDLMETALPPESGYRDSYSYSGATYTWQFAPLQSVQELVIKADATYRRDSYAEWQYPNGTVMLSLLSYANVAKDTSIQSFVSTFCNFTLDNLPLFRSQYERLHAFRGTNHKLIRRGMLDDTGAPALPFVEMALRTQNPRFDPIVADIARYIMKEQVRLNDGTLARYERLPGTVWADDLFMSTPYLMRMGRLTGDHEYFDEAARQVLKFNKYLEDKTTGLYRHGWYEKEKRQSPIAWGRANGWIVWAASEVLTDLPLTHPLRKEIASNYLRHLKAIAARQSDSGLWHQVLDRPDSYEETSCTAMFIIGIARGMKLGILDKSFEPALAKAWSGLQSRIGELGIVKDICRGTEMGEDFDFYNKRERFDNDPRGLGAVITACVEMISIQGRAGLNNNTQH